MLSLACCGSLGPLGSAGRSRLVRPATRSVILQPGSSHLHLHHHLPLLLQPHAVLLLTPPPPTPGQGRRCGAGPGLGGGGPGGGRAAAWWWWLACLPCTLEVSQWSGQPQPSPHCGGHQLSQLGSARSPPLAASCCPAGTVQLTTRCMTFETSLLSPLQFLSALGVFHTS